jgi:hypothetical protein
MAERRAEGTSGDDGGLRRLEEDLRVCLRELQEDVADIRERLTVLERRTLLSAVPAAPRGPRPESREDSRLVYLSRPPGMDALYPGLERVLGAKVNEILPPSHRVTVVPFRKPSSSHSTTVRPIEPALRASMPMPSLSSSDSPRRTSARALYQPRPPTLHGPLPVPTAALPLVASSSTIPAQGAAERRVILLLHLLPIADTPPGASDIADLIRVSEKEGVPGLVLVPRFSTDSLLTTAIREGAFGPRLLQLVIRTGRGLVASDEISKDGLRALASWLLAH